MVTLGKEGTDAARRRAAAVVRGQGPLGKLFSDLAQRYAGRPGGYTRVLQTRRRMGDGAHMAYIEYVARPGELREAMPTPKPEIVQAEAEWARQRAGLATAQQMLRRQLKAGPKKAASAQKLATQKAGSISEAATATATASE